MYHICHNKSKVKPFSVVLLANKGEVLSQHPLKTKQACWKNILAQSKSFWCGTEPISFLVQDDTKEKIETWEYIGQSKRRIAMKSEPRYVAGKNPVKNK